MRFLEYALEGVDLVLEVTYLFPFLFTGECEYSVLCYQLERLQVAFLAFEEAQIKRVVHGKVNCDVVEAA